MSSAAAKIEGEFALLDHDKENPIVVALKRDLKSEHMFHKKDNKVVLGTFERTTVLHADIQTIFNKLFLSSGMIYNYLLKEGYSYLYDEKSRKYDMKHERDAWIGAATAKPIGDNVWHKRFGKCKNYAPRISPVPVHIYAVEEQYITFKDNVITAVTTTSCTFNGPTLRTSRVYRIEEADTPGTCRVTMNYGGLFTDLTDPKAILKAAEGVRNQTFQECSSSPDAAWAWAENAVLHLRGC